MKRSLAETLASNEPVILERPTADGQWERHQLFTQDLVAQAVKAERDRIRSLAYQVGAYYNGDCEDELCGNPHHVIRHFADLIQP